MGFSPVKTCLTDRRGVAAAELALILGIVLVLLLGVFDFGLWIWERMRLETALIAGVHYAQVFPGDSAGIKSAIIATLPADLADAGISDPTLSRDCGPDNPAAPEDGTCASGSPRSFLTLSISHPFVALYFTALTTNELGYVIRVQ